MLVLHGHGMSGELMRSKLGFLRSETKKTVTWTCLDGPISITPTEVAATMAARRAALAKEKGEAEPEAPRAPTPAAAKDGDDAAADEPRPEPTVYSWFKFTGTENAEGVVEYAYSGVSEALAAIDAACAKDGPFDGVLGFSQGAVIASMWIARQQRALLGMPLPEGQVVPQRAQPLKFGIFCSGLLPSDPAERELVTSVPMSQTAIATAHCYGETDEVITPSRSEELRALPMFVAPPAAAMPAITHPGGHAVAGPLRKPLKAFLVARHAEVYPPAPAAPKSKKGGQKV